MDIDRLDELTLELRERGRVIIALLQAPIRVSAFTSLVAGLGIAYGEDVRIESRGDVFVFTAPQGWPDMPAHWPPADEDRG